MVIVVGFVLINEGCVVLWWVVEEVKLCLMWLVVINFNWGGKELVLDDVVCYEVELVMV